MLLVFVAAFVVAFAVGALATRAARDLARRHDQLDVPDTGRPDARKAHARAVPRVGGVGIAAGASAGVGTLVAGSAVADLALPLGGLVPVAAGAAAVFALGLWDDLVGVSFKVRFVVQSAVAWAMTLAGWYVDLSGVPVIGALGPFEQAAIAVPLTVVWTVGLINAVNLLDGLDALAAGTAVLGFAALALAFAPAADPVLLALCVLGAGGTLGFLVFNRAPASVFMGDGGSTLLGFLLAMASVRGVVAMPAGGLVLVPVVALGLPVLDLVTTMARRITEGHSPFLPDADHLHHRAFAQRGDVRVAVAELHTTALIFGAVAVGLRLAVGHPAWQAVVLALTVAFAYGVVRRLGYAPTRDAARLVHRRLRWGVRARLARRQATAHRSGPAGPSGDGHALPEPRLGPPSSTA